MSTFVLVLAVVVAIVGGIITARQQGQIDRITDALEGLEKALKATETNREEERKERVAERESAEKIHAEYQKLRRQLGAWDETE